MKKPGMLLAALLLVVLLAGCGREEPEYKPYQSPADTPKTAVSTSWGTLYYGSRWDECMVTEQEMEEQCLRVDFSARLGDATYPLFQVTIGKGRGALAGQLTGPDGTSRDVYIQSQTISQYPELSEAEQSQLYAMQEEINIVIENLEQK